MEKIESRRELGKDEGEVIDSRLRGNDKVRC